MPAERPVNADFADQHIVEPKIAALRRRNRVRQDAVHHIVARVIPDHKTGIHTLLQWYSVVGPGVVGDIFASRVKLVFEQGVVTPITARVMTINDDDFAGASPRRAANRRIDLGCVYSSRPSG